MHGTRRQIWRFATSEKGFSPLLSLAIAGKKFSCVAPNRRRCPGDKGRTGGPGSASARGRPFPAASMTRCLSEGPPPASPSGATEENRPAVRPERAPEGHAYTVRKKGESRDSADRALSGCGTGPLPVAAAFGRSQRVRGRFRRPGQSMKKAINSRVQGSSGTAAVFRADISSLPKEAFASLGKAASGRSLNRKHPLSMGALRAVLLRKAARNACSNVVSPLCRGKPASRAPFGFAGPAASAPLPNTTPVDPAA